MALKDFVSILRPLNCLMAAFGTFIGYSVAVQGIQFTPQLGITMLVAFLICGGGMVINDYFDRFTDKRLHPNKPIPSRRILPNTAMVYFLSLFVAGIILAIVFLPPVSIAITIGFTILLIAYSAVLTKAKYLGNFIVASGTAFTLIFGASLTGNYFIIAPLAMAALFANLARELIKDLEDMETDKGNKITLPMILGKKKTESFIFLNYVIAIISVYIPVLLLSFGNPLFVVIVSIANFMFLYSFGETVKKDYGRAQLLAKGAMFLALTGFLLGVV